MFKTSKARLCALFRLWFRSVLSVVFGGPFCFYGALQATPIFIAPAWYAVDGFDLAALACQADFFVYSHIIFLVACSRRRVCAGLSEHIIDGVNPILFLGSNVVL